MPRILIGTFFQETNDFHPNDTVYEDFSILRGREMLEDSTGLEDLDSLGGVVGGAVHTLSARDDVEIMPTYSAAMGAGGTITQACFERTASELLDAIERHRAGADGVYLNLHGAMAAEIEKDPEGYVLQEVRRIVGPHVPVVASFDMHGTITRRMLTHMDGCAILHTYPHIDWYETGARAAGVLLRILDGARPVIASVYTPTMVRGDELKTATGVHGTFIRYLERLEERDDVLAGGIMLGHPPTDCPEQGSRVVVITDGNWNLAVREALHIGRSFWNMRSHMQCVLHSVEEGIRIAAQAKGTVVFADAADATSSGAPGTSNTILKEFLGSDYRGCVLFPIRDDPAVARAMDAGVGQTITVPLGGTRDPRFYPGGSHRHGGSARPAGRRSHRGAAVPEHHDFPGGFRSPAVRPVDVSRLRPGPETLRRRGQEAAPYAGRVVRRLGGTNPHHRFAGGGEPQHPHAWPPVRSPTHLSPRPRHDLHAGSGGDRIKPHACLLVTVPPAGKA